MRENVLGAHQQIDHRGAHAALEQHRLASLADLGEQYEILHVAGADLNHVGIAFDDFHAPGIHDFGDHRETVFIADFAQDFEALLAHALIGVGTGAGLVRAAAQDIGARRLDGAGDDVEPVSAFDRAGPGDHRQMAAADLHARHIDDARGRMGLMAGELVGRQHRNHIGHALNGLERRARSSASSPITPMIVR